MGLHLTSWTKVARFLTGGAVGPLVLVAGVLALVAAGLSCSPEPIPLDVSYPDGLAEDLAGEAGEAEDISPQLSTKNVLEIHGADVWHERGYRGQGVKIGILDMGFELYPPSGGRSAPAPVKVRCYSNNVDPPTDKMKHCVSYFAEWGTHGTKITRSVYSVAPEAEYYIANPPTQELVADAVDWMISEGVDIINYSRSATWDGPGNGVSFSAHGLLNSIDRATANGILWVGSSSNQAQHTWMGPYADADNNSRMEFAEGTEFIEIMMDKGAVYKTTFRWEDDWGDRATEMAFIMSGPNGGKRRYATDVLGPEWPVKYLFYVADTTGPHRIQGQLIYANPPPDWVQIMTMPAPMDYPYSIVTGGSIRNPGESASPGMLTVGAANRETPNTIAPYSGRGPTPDGRTKPDVVATDNYYHGLDMRFFRGTSPATAHVSGLAALALQLYRASGYEPSPVVLASFMKGTAIQNGSESPNNTWGHGLVMLPPINNDIDELLQDFADVNSGSYPGNSGPGGGAASSGGGPVQGATDADTSGDSVDAEQDQDDSTPTPPSDSPPPARNISYSTLGQNPAADILQTSSNLTWLLASLAGVLGAGFFIYGACRYMGSAGSALQVEQARSTMFTALAGGVLVALALALVGAIFGAVAGDPMVPQLP